MAHPSASTLRRSHGCCGGRRSVGSSRSRRSFRTTARGRGRTTDSLSRHSLWRSSVIRARMPIDQGPAGKEDSIHQHWERRSASHARTPGSSDFLALMRQRERGKLKVYIGSAAGTGKTYRMLQEAHDLRRRGVDVVIGYVETHNRAETEEQIGNLEVVPRKKIEYRGVTLEEMDVDAVVARRPQVAVVDELAHTNVPGARN